MFFRAAWPRITQQLCRAQGGPGMQKGNRGRQMLGMCRAYGGNRNLPMWRRPCLPDMIDGFVDRQFRNMDRMMGPGFGWMNRRMNRPWWAEEPAYVKDINTKDLDVKYNDELFEVKLDVSEFRPEELKLKIVGSRLLISGRHEEKPDEHGTISREFSRFFPIPEDVDMESFKSVFTDDGFLVVSGNVKQTEATKTKSIDIERESPSK